MSYSVYQSIQDAYLKSDNINIKAEIFLNVYRKDEISNDYMKYTKAIMNILKKIKNLRDKNENSQYIEEYEKEITELNKKKDILLTQAIETHHYNITDCKLIAIRLISRYGRGLRIVDTFKGLLHKDAPYGILINDLFKSISSKSIFKIFNSEKTYYQEILELEPRLLEKDYLSSKEGAEKIENYFILFLINLSTKDFDENELRKMLDEVATEVGKGDQDLAKRIQSIYKTGTLTGNFSRTLLQIIRLSVGKGAFMNTSVIVTNIVLRKIIGKGLTYPQNAILRNLLARTLGSGPMALVINVVLIIPDIASIINRRDYVAAINTIFLLYFLRTGLT